MLVGFDEVGASVFAVLGDARVSRFPRFRASAARLALGLGFRCTVGERGGSKLCTVSRMIKKSTL